MIFRFRSNLIAQTVGLLLSCSALFLVAQEQPPTTLPFAETPKLETAFADDFSLDSRAEYEVEGDTNWKVGQVTLGSEAVLRRELNAAYWLTMEFELELPELPREQENSEVRIWLDLDETEATDCFASIRQFREAGEVKTTLAIFDTESDWQENLNPALIGKPIELTKSLSGTWRISYRYGLWAITPPNEQAYYRSIDNFEASADGIVVTVEQGNVGLHGITAQIVKRQVLSKKNAKAFETARNLGSQAIELNDNSGAEALFKQALEIFENSLGEKHPLYGTTLNSLGGLYHAQSNYAEAKPLYERSLEILKLLVGANHPDVGTVLNRLARVHQDQANFSEAELLYKQALEADRNTLGKEHPNYSIKLNNLALLYCQQGSYAKAEPLFIQSLEIDREVLGEQHTNYGDTLNNLATLYEAQGNYDKAEAFYKQALEIDKNALGDQHPSYGIKLNNLAWMYYVQGKLAEAERIYNQALEIYEKAWGADHPEYGTTLGNLALVYKAKGQYSKAEGLYKQILKIKKKSWGEEHPNYGIALHNLAQLYQAQGTYAKAEPLYKQALEIDRNALGDQHPNYGDTLNSLAWLYYVQGNYAQAEPLYRQALNIYKNALGEENTDYGDALNNLALLYQAQGNYAKAEPLLLQALEIDKNALGEDHPSYSITLNNLALLYSDQGNYAQAERLYKQALDIDKNALSESHPNYALSLSNLACTHEAQGNYAQAEPEYLKALEIYRNALGEEHPKYGNTLLHLALLHCVQGNYAQAETLFKQALEIFKNALGEEHPDYGYTLEHLAWLNFLRGSHEQAESFFQQSIKVMRNNIERYATIQSDQQQRIYQRSVEYSLAEYHLNALQAKKFGQPAFELALAWKGAGQLRQKEYRKLASEAGSSKLFQQLRDTSQQLFVHLNRDVEAESWKPKFDELSADKERIEKELAKSSAAFHRVNQEIGLSHLLAALPKEAVLVDFHEFVGIKKDEDGQNQATENLLAFVVRHDHPVQMIDLGERTSIYAAINKWRTPMDPQRDGPATWAAAATAGTQLRERLWLPLEKHFGELETVLLSPVGELGTLPFGALPGDKPNSYLIERYRIATIPVPRLLPQLVERPESNDIPAGDLLLLGDVDYQSAPRETVAAKQKRKRRNRSAEQVFRGTQFDNLTETAGEIATIKELFFESFDAPPESVRTLKRDEASEALLTKFAPQYQILHIATHGFFADPEHAAITNVKLNENDITGRGNSNRTPRSSIELRNAYHPGLLSGLALAGANLAQKEDSADDGIVTAEEISFLPLNGVDLVTLSACQTGLGKSAGGEGLIGLQRAFQISGARTVVASLWKVDDTATRRLMERFYRNMFEKEMSKLDAIIEAQRWAINNPQAMRSLDIGGKDEAQRSDPRLWAAWTLSGDWN